MKITMENLESAEEKFDPNTMIHFPNGLPGFEDCKRFKIVHSEKSPIIVWLQSLDDPNVEFSLADPELLKVTYDLTLTDEENNTLQLEAGDGLKTAVLLSQQDKNDITEQSGILANFKSPIVINLSKRIAIQKSFSSAELLISP
jgi:flagellar assembly factor FliW